MTRAITSPDGRHWLALLAAAGALSMVMIDATGTVVALPTIQAQFGLGHGEQQWIITIYSLALAATVATGGLLGDTVGRIRIFVIGVTLFALGSLICAVAPNLSVLLCGRIVEGLGNVSMAPAAALLAADSFGPANRGKAMGLYSGIGGLAMICGPILAGVLVEAGGWRSAFLVNIPLGALTLAMIWIARPAPSICSPGRFNLLHSLLLAAALGSVVFALQESRDWSWHSPFIYGLLGLGGVLLALFARLQSRDQFPLIDVKLLQDRRFAASCIILFCGQFSLIGQSAFGASFLQRIFHFSPIDTGLVMLFLLVPLMISAPISGVLYDRFGLKIPAVIGLGFAILGFILEAQVLPLLELGWLLPALTLIGFGMGLALTQTYTDGPSRVADPERGRAFGTLDTMRQLGGAVGMAVVGAVVVQSETTRVVDIASGAAPTAVVRGQLEALMARAVYGDPGAVRTIQEQWPAIRSALRDSGPQSIAAGYHVSILVLLLGLIAVVLLLGKLSRRTR